MVRLAFIGAGNRAHTYLEWVRRNPERACVVAAVDINREVLEEFAQGASLPANACFATVDELIASRIEVDAVIICTPEGAHRDPALKALQRGWHILLEKPVAPTIEECQEIISAAERSGKIASVCHVLRYNTYFRRLHDIIAEGSLGKVVSINHRVRVGLDRATHTFVRGPWGDTNSTSAIMLSKCCHDVDLLLWILGEDATDVRTLGSLGWFRPENAPEGSAQRCIDCAVEKSCRFSAVDLYQRRRQWIRTFRTPTPDEAIDRQLREGRYGRCVYHCDNNAPDRQALIFTTPSNALVTITMEFFTDDDSRLTTIALSGGEIIADSRTIRIHRFASSTAPEANEIITFPDETFGAYHGGADLAVVDDFISAIDTPGHRLLTPLASALESHRVCLSS